MLEADHTTAKFSKTWTCRVCHPQYDGQRLHTLLLYMRFEKTGCGRSPVMGCVPLLIGIPG
ncbi:hypothetical protein [Nostoc parmelioides]|uniref:hypothetical protein n=1 Tax=Nostoc parmelioides TaxID=1521621 RepID=UPI001687FD4B|nr:hypothetical protein [Nostoc parmelioides]